ncbi:MAG: monovalent cation/H+ antiporter subunit D family protein [Chloroflexota bacterium]
MTLTRHFPVLIIITPLLTAVIISILSEWKKSLALPLSIIALSASLLMSVSLIPETLRMGYISYRLSAWEPPFGIEIRIDYLGLFMMVLVSLVSLISVIYSGKYIRREVSADREAVYYSLFMLIAGSMLGFLATGDIFNMFVFIEIMSITSYALVAIAGEGRAIRAAFRYLIMGAPSSILILLAISFLYAVTGTLNMGDLTAKIASSAYPKVVTVAYGVFIIGFAVKAALFPLHQWLPDVHSIAPSPVSALLSGLVVKMGIFGVIRLALSIYTTRYSGGANAVTGLLAWVGAGAILFGSVMAIRQEELKRMVAYSTVAHVGYIFTGIGLMEKASLVGSIYHILDHSLAKACLFLVAGAVIYATGYRRINDLRGAAKKMPLSCAAFALASLSVIGIPPTAGFVSKWYLIRGSFTAGNLVPGIVILIGSVLAAWYCLRIVYYMFFLPTEDGKWDKIKGDAPLPMVAPPLILSSLTLLLGVFAYLILPSLTKAIERLIA